MGKATKWLKSLLKGKTPPDGKKEKDLASLLPPLPTQQLPIAKEKKRWRFWRHTVARSSISMLVGDQPPEAESSQRRQAMTVVAATAATAEAAFVAARASAAVVRVTPGYNHLKAEEVAATRIQSAFRGYLARKALCALRGLVKLQALVRGHLIRKQAAAARCYIQALITAQSHGIQMAEDSPIILKRKFIHRRLPQHLRSRHSHTSPNHVLVSDGVEKLRRNYMDRAAEDIKTIEIDPGVSRGSTRSRSSYSLTQSETKQNWFSEACGHAGTPSKVDQPTEFSPCNGAYSEHFEDFVFAKAQSSPYYLSSISVPDATHPHDHHFFPSYMANTESSRAKARSQSAPRQRTDAIGQQTGRRRLSMEGRNPLGSVKMQPSSSQIGMMANGHQYPWSLKLHKPNMSLKASECTVLMNTNNGRSLVNRNKHD